MINYDTLLQNATAILLQNATKVYDKMRQVFHYKMRQFYLKMRQLLQIATILLQNATFITNCDSTSKLNICFTTISDPEQPCMCCFG